MLRNTKVLTTARQKRPSAASTRTLSRPANAGGVTRSQCMNTSASANPIGYTANIRRNAAYGAPSNEPDRSSARTNDIPRLVCCVSERFPNRNGPVNRRALVCLRDEIEDLDDVGIDIDVASAFDESCVHIQCRPSRERLCKSGIT